MRPVPISAQNSTIQKTRTCSTIRCKIHPWHGIVGTGRSGPKLVAREWRASVVKKKKTPFSEMRINITTASVQRKQNPNCPERTRTKSLSNCEEKSLPNRRTIIVFQGPKRFDSLKKGTFRIVSANDPKRSAPMTKYLALSSICSARQHSTRSCADKATG